MTGDLDAAATPHGDGPVADDPQPRVDAGPATPVPASRRTRPDPRDADPRDPAPRGGEPRDGEPRDAEPRDADPRDAGPRDVDPRATGGQDDRAQERTPAEPSAPPAADADADADPDAPSGATSGTDTTSRTAGGKKSGRRSGSTFRELVVLVVLVLGFTFLLRALVFEAYLIPSGSMENTLRVSDKVLVDKISYRFGSIRRGDVIVFNGAGSFTPATTLPPSGPVQRLRDGFAEFFGGTPTGEEDFTKRVIGLPGDRVECRATGGGHAMFVNGVRLQERSYLFPGDEPCTRTFAGGDAIVVPQGRLWVMGDHRSLSADSREHVDDGHLGTVPEDEVIGKAFAIAWPAAHWTGLSRPATFDQPALRHG